MEPQTQSKEEVWVQALALGWEPPRWLPRARDPDALYPLALALTMDDCRQGAAQLIDDGNSQAGERIRHARWTEDRKGTRTTNTSESSVALDSTESLASLEQVPSRIVVGPVLDGVASLAFLGPKAVGAFNGRIQCFPFPSLPFPASSVNLAPSPGRFAWTGPASQFNRCHAMSAMFNGVRGKNSYKVSTVSDGGLRYD